MKVQNGGRKTKKGVKAARNIKRLKQTYDKLKFHAVKEVLRTVKEIKKYLIQKMSRNCKELKAVEPPTKESSAELEKCLDRIQAIKTAPQDILINVVTSLLAGDTPHSDSKTGVIPLITSHKRFVSEIASWKEKLSQVKRPKKVVEDQVPEDTPQAQGAAVLPKSKHMLLALDDPANAPVKKKRPPKNRNRTDTTMNKYMAIDDRDYSKPAWLMQREKKKRSEPMQASVAAPVAPIVEPTRRQPERHAPRQQYAPNTDKHTKHMSNNAPKKDELHPSWVAKQQQKIAIGSINAAPAGKKIVFD